MEIMIPHDKKGTPNTKIIMPLLSDYDIKDGS